MQKLPYLKYLQTLILGRVIAPQIVKRLNKIGITLPDINILEKIRYDLNMDYPAHFSAEKPPMDPEILKDLAITKMFGYVFDARFPEGTEGIDGAFKIQNDPHMYKLITSLCFAKITPEDIDLVANSKTNSDYAPEDIKEFIYYFFNMDGWSIREKESYIQSISSEDHRRYYKLALKDDKNYLLWKLGAAPDKPFDEMLKEMAVDSYYNFKERTKYDPELAQKWGQLVVKLTEKIERLEKDTRDKKNLFDEIVFSLSNNSEKNKKSDSYVKEVPHISHLKGKVVNG